MLVSRKGWRLHPFLFGKQFLKLLWNWEEKNPEYTGRHGEYPLFYFLPT
jgi:hypothetical protein